MNSLNTEEVCLCPICSSNSIFWECIEANKFSEDLEKNKILFSAYKLYKCTFCGHGFFNPGLKNEKELLSIYDKSYSNNYNPQINNNMSVLRKKQYALDVALLENFVGTKNISVLDFGCSMGGFLNEMPQSWIKFGYEVNKAELEYVSENFKDINLFSDLTKISGNHFDVITLRGVIEHFFDFDTFFTVIKNNLNEKGLIFICATPDFNSPCALMYRNRWNQISAPAHYHQFTAASITLLFAKHGFGLKELQYPYGKTPYADFESDANIFIDNIDQIINQKKPTNTHHAYPGTMMSLVFEKIR